MAVLSPSPVKDVNRKRRAHTKSRVGCGNCKIRRVKCDEIKPTCRRCTDFGVSCNYDNKSSNLQSSVDGAFKIEIPKTFPSSMNRTILNLLNTPLNLQSTGSLRRGAAYHWSMQDLELLHKFQVKTVYTIGTAKSCHVFKDVIIKLGCAHPYLFHAVMALTLMHDRSQSQNSKASAAEAFHWYQSTVLFNGKLSKDINPFERDSMWATSAMLGVLSMACIDAKNPEEAWPLKPASSSDLDWLRMSDGKKEVLKITDPFRPDGLFMQLASEDLTFFVPTCQIRVDLDPLPAGFLELYSIDPTSTAEKNPYHEAVFILARLLNIECSHSTILKFLCFITNIDPNYKRLLEQKDPRALLLLAYWYAKVSQYQQWWIWRRAVLECQATCIYLEKYHGHESAIQELLQFPRMMCGLGVR